jgi:hypothetical protein
MRRPALLLLCCCAFILAVSPRAASPQMQQASKSRAQMPAVPSGRHMVEFEVRTGLTGLGGPSTDLMLIVFSNRSADTPLVPSPLFGDDILAEFAFSGRDAPPGKALIFRRYVADVSFLSARYIRLVNQGLDSWAGESISLRLDGKAVLDRESLYPRKGAQAKGGIEKFDASDWKDRNFWEADLQRIRIDRY